MHMYLGAQTISNVSAIQEQNNIVVSYHLDNKVPCKVNLYVSEGKGVWKGPLKQVKGDVGENVKTGVNNISWDVLTEFSELKGSDICFKVETEDMLKKVGDYYQGGYIVFIEDGHGLIATIDDLGFSNWVDAKSDCENLVLNGYNDWYLPNKNELNLIYLNKVRIGHLTNDFYWSSTEYDNNRIYVQSFKNSELKYFDKYYSNCYVRPVRAFKIL